MLDWGGRRFLEVERFDRLRASGRRGLLTLGAIEDAFLDQTSFDWTWMTAATLLESSGLIDAAESRQLRWRWCFGDLIGNSDMHRSNTSLWFGDAMPLTLTPSYDMLPMLFAPGPQGDLGGRLFSPRPPLPALATVWPDAARAASEFWSQVTADGRISEGFRVVARGAAAEVGRLLEQFG